MRRRKAYLVGLLCIGVQAVHAETWEWSLFSTGNWGETYKWVERPNSEFFIWLWPVGDATKIHRVFPVGGVLDTVVTINAFTILPPSLGGFGVVPTTDDLYINNNGTSASAEVLLLWGGQLSAQHVSVGYPARGKFTQLDGLLDTTALSLGAGRTGNGVYTLGGGELRAMNVAIGNTAPGDFLGGTGNFFQAGGTFNVSAWLRLAYNTGASASFELIDGELNAPEVVIASSGQAVFTQIGGTHIVTESLRLGMGGRDQPFDPDPDGTYELGNGTLITKDVSVERGHFLQVGGVHSVSGTLNVGPSDLIFEGVYTLSGGTLSVNRIVNGRERPVLSNGIGIFNLDGGTLAMNGSMDVDEFNIGNAPASNAFFNFVSGQTLTATMEAIGVEGVGKLTHVGGTHTVASDLTLGKESNGHGEYLLAGGTLNVETLTIGDAGTGIFTHSGGTNNVTSLGVSSNGSSYILNFGHLNADSITAETASALDFQGGTLSVDLFTGSLVNDGGTLTPGDSIGGTMIRGSYEQTANGTLTIELGGTADGEFDTVVVDGTASLGGVLDVVSTGGFNPALGHHFDIARADSFTGSFQSPRFPPIGSAQRWLISYIPDPVAQDVILRISVVAAVSTDFDFDGDVDRYDYFLFDRCSSAPGVQYDRKCYGSVQAMDNDDDDDIDLADFAVVQRCHSGEGRAADPACAG